MKSKPRFTDQHRYPNSYRPALHTNVGATIARERQRLKALAERNQANAAEAEVKVERLPTKKAAAG